MGTEHPGLQGRALGFVWQPGFQEGADVFSNSSRSRAKTPPDVQLQSNVRRLVLLKMWLK